MANSKIQCSCGCKTRERREDMMKMPNGKHFINEDHVAAFVTNPKIKRKREVDEAKERRKEHRLKKADFYSKDPVKQKALTQAAANKLCSLLDAGKPCISCGRPLRGGRFQHSSHFKSRGASSFLSYSLLNLHLSCVVCNQWRSGEIEGYRKGLLERYGQWILDYLDNAPRSKEWECDELITLRKEYNAEIRHIEKGNPPTKSWRELPCNKVKAIGKTN